MNPLRISPLDIRLKNMDFISAITPVSLMCKSLYSDVSDYSRKNNKIFHFNPLNIS